MSTQKTILVLGTNAGQADLIAIGREALYNPNWPHHTAAALGADELSVRSSMIATRRSCAASSRSSVLVRRVRMCSSSYSARSARTRKTATSSLLDPRDDAGALACSASPSADTSPRNGIASKLTVYGEP